MLCLDYWQTEAFLQERGVPLIYPAADLEADNATLDKLELAKVGVTLVMDQRNEPTPMPPGHHSRADDLWRHRPAGPRRRVAPGGRKSYDGNCGGPDREALWRIRRDSGIRRNIGPAIGDEGRHCGSRRPGGDRGFAIGGRARERPVPLLRPFRWTESRICRSRDRS